MSEYEKTSEEILGVLLRIKKILGDQFENILKQISTLLANRLNIEKPEQLALRVLQTLEKIENVEEKKEKKGHMGNLLKYQKEQIHFFVFLQNLVEELEKNPSKKEQINLLLQEINQSIDSEINEIKKENKD